MRVCRFPSCVAAALGALWAGTVLAASSFRVATYNVEGYLDTPTETRAAKSAVARAKVRESIQALKPDVLALQEIGTTNALLELRDSLRAEGLDFPYWEHVPGPDTNLHVAVLSRFPFTASRSHTNEQFLLDGRRYHVSRGFAELEVRVNPDYSFTLLSAHLKSKRTVSRGDEADLRLEEAKLLRARIDAILNAQPGANLIVLGDFNDTPDAPSTRAILGRYRLKLIDTRPCESDPCPTAASPASPGHRTITWTDYYAKDDTYARFDYLLLSPGMAREWVTNQTCVLALPDWGVASDHRPLVATFEAVDK